MAVLVMERGPEVGKAFPISSRQVTLGRSSVNDIVLDLPTISRTHVSIAQQGDVFVLEDLQSTNGTFLNNQPVTRSRLREGDRIRLGKVVLRFTEVLQQEREPAVELVATDQATDTASVIERMEVEGYDLLGAGEPTNLAELQGRLALVSQISAELLQVLDAQELADRVVAWLLGVLPKAEQVLFATVDEENGQLTTRAARRRGGQLTRDVSLSQTILKLVTEKREAVLCADVTGDARFRDRPSVVGARIRSFLCVPLVCRGEFLGTLYVDSRRALNHLEREDLILATAIAGQVALAVSNIRLHHSVVARERLELDLSLAEQLQRSFLPISTPDVPEMTFATYYATAYEVGGDFYDFIPLEDGRLLVVIGDVSGKGIPAALMMARLTRDIRYHAVRTGPAHVLSELSQAMARQTDGRVFATLLCLEVAPTDGRMVMASAGHCPPVICPGQAAGPERSRREPYLATDVTGFPLGVVPDEPYDEAVLTLQPGDTVLAYTDGVTEAMNAAGAIFGSDRLLDAVAAYEEASRPGNSGRPPTTEPQGLLDKLLAALRTYRGDAAPTDDLTMVAFSWSGTATLGLPVGPSAQEGVCGRQGVQSRQAKLDGSDPGTPRSRPSPEKES